MTPKQYNYIFGPLYSWRLGMSLGIDPISAVEKICNFDCVYCQLGRTLHFQNERKAFVPTQDILDEVKSLPKGEIDYYTFSGKGETTLAKNLGEMIKGVRQLGLGKIAVITNGSMLDRESVKLDLIDADLVMTKLEACDLLSLKDVNAPVSDISFESIFNGLLQFRDCFKGKLCLQIMFVEQNKKYVKEIAKLVELVRADEIHINTPLRPSEADPLTKEEISELKQYFTSSKVFSVYDKKVCDVEPLNEADTKERHGLFNDGTSLD